MRLFFNTSSPGLYWGYYLAHGNNMRFGEPHHPVYSRLLDTIGLKQDCHVITTNVDALFVRNGFPADRMYTPQGDYALLQCRKPCRNDTWPSKPIINRLLPAVDPLTQKLPEAIVPVCPNCGGPVFYNLRGGNWFVDAPYQEQCRRYQSWVEKNWNRRILFTGTAEFYSSISEPVLKRRPGSAGPLKN